MEAARATTIARFFRDRPLAHKILFRHRHKHPTTDAHDEMIRDWHSADQFRQWMAFRGFGKSTVAEEAVALAACFREFKNYLIVGSSFERAAERLRAVSYELENNEEISQLFGDMRGPVWGVEKVILSNGVMIQAIGREQALRGVKYLDQRPDGAFVDDIETRVAVRTPEGRQAMLAWFMTELLPALDPVAKIRVCATPLHEEGLPYQLMKGGEHEAPSEWKTRIYPIEYKDVDGVVQPTWPERFPPEKIAALRSSFASRGLSREFDMEYMCKAASSESKPFTADMYRIEPQVKTWQATFAMFDPARTTNAKSATTGYAAWSWIGNRLVVWDAWGKFLMPDQIVAEVFNCNEDMRPVMIGVEEDGLNEFLMQPIRAEQVRRGEAIPVQAMKAPKGKMDFIRGLQPFFKAHEVIFAKELPDLKAQLSGFPTGRIDVPNALAYALKMRPGQPMYEGFNTGHVAEDMMPAAGTPAWLCINATQGLVTAALCQVVNGAFRIYADWVREGEAADVLHDIVKDACIETGRAVRLCAPPSHFDKYNNVGLVQAARAIPLEVRRGLDAGAGRVELRSLLAKDVRGAPGFKVCELARWTLNGFAAGYSRGLNKQGMLDDAAQDNQYRVLLEGIESFAGLLKLGSPDDEDRGSINYNYTPDGRRYVSAMVNRRK